MAARNVSDRGGGSRSTPRSGEIYFEHQFVGHLVRVSAVDAATGVEVIIMGPAKARQADLEAVALRKLRYVMSQKADRRT